MGWNNLILILPLEMRTDTYDIVILFKLRLVLLLQILIVFWFPQYLSSVLEIITTLEISVFCPFITSRLMMLFSQKEDFQTIKMSFHYSRKFFIFPKGLTRDSGQKFHISFEPTSLQKRPWFCRLMILFSQKLVCLVDRNVIFLLSKNLQYFRRG